MTSCQYPEVFKITYFEEHLQTAVSAFLESVFGKNFFGENLAQQRELLMKQK